MQAAFASQPTPAVRFTDVCRRFDSQLALDSVSFEVRVGECFGLVGGNGAGKTTLVKCMLDFIAPHSGDIKIFGVPSTHTVARAKLAFLPERFLAPYYLKGREYLQYMLSLHGQTYDNTRVEHLLSMLDLDRSALGKPVRTYSKGMTQKLGLAACFLSKADLLLFDEPSTGLDPKARALFKARVRESVSEGRSVLLTSHSLPDVNEMCHRMAILHSGRLLFVGSPHDLRQQHATDSLETAYLSCIARGEDEPDNSHPLT